MKRFVKCICILLTLALLCVSVPVSAADTSDAPLNVVVQNFDGTFSPFFYSLASDESVVALTGAPLLAYDRGGMMVLNGAEAPEADMEFAAKTAAWFSSVKERGSVEVDYTRARNLKKPPAARPGYVIYHVYQTVYAKAEQPQG